MGEGKRRLIDDAQRVNPVQGIHRWRSPAAAATEVVVLAHLDVYGAIHEAAVASLPNETGGFLVGRVMHDARDACWVVEIEQVLPVEPIVQQPTHFLFTWRDVDRVRTYRETSGKALLGWYHTHPGMGIFLSDTDLERTHRVLFSEPFQIALVYDPVCGRAGYFFWEGPQEIDASVAAWREFTIAFEGSPPQDTVEAVPSATADAATAPTMEAEPDDAADTERPSDGTPGGSAAAGPIPTTDQETRLPESVVNGPVKRRLFGGWLKRV